MEVLWGCVVEMAQGLANRAYHDPCHQGSYNLDGLVSYKFMEKGNNAIRWYKPKYQ